MKLLHKIYSVLAASILLTSCQDTVPTVQLQNTSDIERHDETIVLTRAEVIQKVGKIDNQFVTVSTLDGKDLPSQWDDLNGDGEWDELAFEVNLPKSSTVEVALHLVSQKPVYKKTTQFYMAKSEKKDNHFTKVTREVRPEDHIDPCYPMFYQFEGFGWENDQVAFRSYFDSRNGKDIFGKKVKELVLQDVGADGNTNNRYHKMDDWGLDVLKVGGSLGAGAIGIEKEGQLYRLGLTQSATFETIAEGAVRAIGKVTYKGWIVEGTTYDVTETITIWKGKHYYESKVELIGNDEPVNIITGIVNLKSKDHVNYPNFNDQIACVETYGNQSENKKNPEEKLGMAIMLDKSSFVGFMEAPSTSYEKAIKMKHQKHGEKKDEPITDTYIVKMKQQPKSSVKYRYFSGWELNNDKFKTEEGFLKLLNTEANKLAHPIQII